MTVKRIPKDLTKEFLPGLEEQHEVGLSGVGVSVVYATIAVNTSQTAAELLASPPNTAATACGPVIHSLGTAPTTVLLQHRATPAAVTGLNAAVHTQYITADNSAVYFFAKTWTGTAPVGAAVKVTAIR